MPQEPSAELVARWRDNHDQEAADAVFHRYADRLIALARNQLSHRLRRRVDPEDAVLSACRSFFVRLGDGRLNFGPGDSLWRLLATITTCKVRHLLERHTAGKRAMNREQEAYVNASALHQGTEWSNREPSPHDAAAMVDELEHVVQELTPLQRTVLELRLQGLSDDQIAANIHRAERTVRRITEQVEQRLKLRLDDVRHS